MVIGPFKRLEFCVLCNTHNHTHNHTHTPLIIKLLQFHATNSITLKKEFKDPESCTTGLNQLADLTRICVHNFIISTKRLKL